MMLNIYTLDQTRSDDLYNFNTFFYLLFVVFVVGDTCNWLMEPLGKLSLMACFFMDIFMLSE